MAKLTLEVKDCQDCPNCKRTKYYTEDSWEHAEDFWCTLVAADNTKDRDPQRHGMVYKKIAGYVEWRKEMPEVPEWCPIRSKEERYSDYLADLRNKYGRIHSYFQFKEIDEREEGAFAGAAKCLAELEETIISDNRFFVDLLKTDIDSWVWKEKP